MEGKLSVPSQAGSRMLQKWTTQEIIDGSHLLGLSGEPPVFYSEVLASCSIL